MALLQPGTELGPAGHGAAGAAAPYVAATVELADAAPAAAVLRADGWCAAATWDGTTVALETTDAAGRTQRHVSRRHGRPPADAPPARLTLTLTGRRVAALARPASGASVVRAFYDLPGPRDQDDLVPVHDPDWLASIRAEADQAGRFGQLGLRDVRLVTTAEGMPYAPPDEPDGTVLLTATSAGTGGFTTGHTSVWAFEPAAVALRHRADLFTRRPGADGAPGVYGDHAVHLVRVDDGWLLAASTWGDFDRHRRPGVGCVVGTPLGDPTHGVQVVDVRPLELAGLDAVPGGSVGSWDPHLVRTDDGWLVAAVSARKFFDFHPVLATGPDLDRLVVRAAATTRSACEGVTLSRLDGRWWVLASEGRDGRREQRASYPVLDLELREAGRLAAAYPTNIPWPTLVPGPEGPLLVGFDATPAGGALPGYGTHGDLVVQGVA